MRQGSAEWFAARLGAATASRICDVVARTKKGWGAARGHYMIELIAERLSGRNADHYVSVPMQWGIDNEPFAREAYELETGELVGQIGFVPHPTIEKSGASPDGLVGSMGLIQIKCPTTETHIETLLSGEIPENHFPQLAWELACTGREWNDFVSYDPRLPEPSRKFIKRYDRDDTFIASLEADVREFLEEVADKVAMIKRGVSIREIATEALKAKETA